MSLSDILGDREGYDPSNGQSPRVYLFDRLKREGRWDEASAWRKERQIELHQDGLGKSEDRSWSDMADNFPPVVGVSDEELPPDEVIEPPNGQAVHGHRKERSQDYAASEAPQYEARTDAEWVYFNLTNPNPDPKSAPTQGGWGLLQWAIENKKEFYRTYAPKVLGADSAKDSDDVKDEKRSVQERLDVFNSLMSDYEKKKRLVLGATEPGAQTSDPGTQTQKNTRFITLLHAR